MKVHFKLSNDIDYSCILRESKRAKRIILKRARSGELVLVIPHNRRISQNLLLDILKKNEDFILKSHKEEISAPNELNLQAINEVWTINYIPSGLSKIKKKIHENTKVLEIFSASSLEDISKIINSFLVFYCKKFLEERLKYCSSLYNLPLAHKEVLKISLARGRWGAYAKKKYISLNARLLLLPIELVDYIILHELCHTVHLNHSPKFYALLEEKMPDYKQREREIKNYPLASIFWL